jgi:outer membrane protein assembly factor BamB
LALFLTSGSALDAQQARPSSNPPCGGFSTGASVDWPQFHFDPCHTGYNPNEFLLSPATVPDLVLDWQVPVLGSSPAVANGIVYLGASDGLYAFKARMGALLWKYTIATGAGVPAVGDGMVYFDSYGGLYALNAATGELLWAHIATLGGDSSPTVADGLVYFFDDDGISALNAKTGALPHHVFRNSRFRDWDSQFAQLAVNAGCSPAWVGETHLSNQRSHLG